MCVRDCACSHRAGRGVRWPQKARPAGEAAERQPSAANNGRLLKVEVSIAGDMASRGQARHRRSDAAATRSPAHKDTREPAVPAVDEHARDDSNGHGMSSAPLAVQ
jgi:hypothetical protein